MRIFDGDVAIILPADLIAVLREVKASVAQGRLREVRVNDPLIPSTRLNDVTEEGPWPDFIIAVFEDPQGNRYELAVETYHGMGGSWSQVKSNTV